MQCTALSGSETGPITTQLPSATDRERRGGEFAAAGHQSPEHPEAYAHICRASTPTAKRGTQKEEGKKSRRRERREDLLFFFPSFSVYLTFSFFLYALWDLFGQLTLMLPPAQMHISCDEPTACWIFPQISHAVGWAISVEGNLILQISTLETEVGGHHGDHHCQYRGGPGSRG
ncbi:hypothetical protein DNTS_028639 [Danionella cerebrum]|uniref:Uncharacterized protein n=1 Tax=Danionella cerebrum TaxID=2873325 RepID=A0A553QL92_9TELE|nr:hypothetical protein DNTS_028639 [Danionella translucida]